MFIQAVTGNNALFVSLLDPARQTRRCVYAWSDGAEVDVGELPVMPMSGSTAPHARAVATGQVTVVTDLQAALAGSPNVALGYERDPRAPNISIAVPLIHLGEVIGGFEVQILDHPNPSECVPSLQVAANLAAAAIENLRLINNERQLRQAAQASEERYRSSERRLRLALEAAGLGTWESAGTRELAWSQGAERVLGHPDRPTPRSWRELLDLVHTQDRERVAEALESAARSPGTREVEFRVAAAEGETRWLVCRMHTMWDAAGLPPRVLGVLLDITARKEAEQQRQTLARSEHLRALGQMASGIAHDLNQSLALISGYGELAQDALATAPPDLGDAVNMMGMAVRAAQDGAHTLQQLLAFARSTEADMLETVDIIELLREVAELTAPRWRTATQLEVEVPEDTQLFVAASHGALREAFTNLIFNAVDALSEGGIIRLRATALEDRVVAEVIDNGPGIPPELQTRIFEPFFTTKGDRGTGLGLPQVRGVVARYGGELSLESEVGRGTMFRIALPRTERSADARRAERQPTAQRVGARRVLAVDDEPKLRAMIARVLQSDGHEVTLAPSGEEALALTQQHGPYDLVLTDVSMGPGLSGWDLADLVHERWPHVPVILASGWGAQIDPTEAAERGIAGVLAKPFRISELRELVASLTGTDQLGGNSPTSDQV